MVVTWSLYFSEVHVGLLNGFPDNKMNELLFGARKSGGNNEVRDSNV